MNMNTITITGTITSIHDGTPYIADGECTFVLYGAYGVIKSDMVHVTGKIIDTSGYPIVSVTTCEVIERANNERHE